MVNLSKYIGDFGRWQCYVFTVCALTGFVGAMQIYVMTFFTPKLDYWCARPDALKGDIPLAVWRNHSSPREVVQGVVKINPCRVYDADYAGLEGSDVAQMRGKKTKDCTKWEFDKRMYERTMIEEFNLVCSRDILISTSNAVYMAAFMVSVLMTGHWADRFGRRTVILMTGLFMTVFSVAMAFSTSFVMFMFLRACQCFFGMGLGTVAFTMFAETCSQKHRAVLGNLFFWGFTFGTICFAGLSYKLKNWVQIQLTISLLCALLLILLWFLPESPKWLVIKEQYHEASLEIERAVRWNRMTPVDPKTIEKDLKKSKMSSKEVVENVHYSFFDLLKHPSLRHKTLNLFLCWPVNAFVYYGLSFNTNDLGGNPFTNFLISSGVEIPAYTIAAIASKYAGRRSSITAMMIAAGIACATPIVVPKGSTLQIILPMFGKLCISASYGMIYVYSSELFPTVVRSIGIGSCSMIGRLGSILAPYVKELGKHTHANFPPVIYGFLSVVSALLILLLPETKGQAIPDSLEEVSKIKSNKKQLKGKNS